MAVDFSDSRRSTGYKCGVGLLWFASLLFVAGFASPFWEEEDGMSSGLWQVCSSNLTWCDVIDTEGQEGWFTACRVLETVALALLLLASLWALVVNTLTRERPPLTHLLETVTAVAGVVGFTGAIIYGAMRKKETFENISWAFYLATFGSLLVVNSAALIARCYYDNKKSGSSRDGTGLTSVSGLGYTRYQDDK